MFVPFVTALALTSAVLAAPAPQAASAKTSTTTSKAATSSVAASSTVASSASTAPSPTTDSSLPSPTLPYASDDPNGSFLDQFQNTTPEPVRGSRGASILGPQNLPLDRQNPDLLDGPSTDSGAV